MSDTTTEDEKLPEELTFDNAPTSNKPLSEAQQEEEPKNDSYIAVLRDTNLMNHLQLEYTLLQALEYHLGSMQVIREYNRTILTIPVNYLQRAKITIEINDSIICTECNSEIVNPEYKQTAHKDCKHPGR